MTKIKKTKVAVLPLSIANDFEKIDFSKIERNYALKFLSIIMKKSNKETGLIDTFVNIPKNYFLKTFNKNYLIWLEKLIFAKIIIKNNSYNNLLNNNNYSKSYSINNKTTSLPLMCPDFKKILVKSIPYVVQNDVLTGDENKVFFMVIEDLKKLNIYEEELYKLTDDYVKSLTIENFNINEKVTKEAFNVKYLSSVKNKKYWMQKELAIEKAKKENQTLIQDGDNFYIGCPEDFIIRKKVSIQQSYNASIKNIEYKNFYGKRNETNNRLDTNLTNMPKLLVNRICYNNKLVQFDLCNAQFAILSHYLEGVLSTSDFSDFKAQSYEGVLYEYMQEKLGLKTRYEAKKMMFELMFSNEEYNSELKTKLKSIFPSVVEFVDNYKRENGYKNFSIMLQKIESEIFIDGLWKTLKRKKIFCTPKHDCLIVREKDTEKVKDIIQEYFKKINFKGKVIQE